MELLQLYPILGSGNEKLKMYDMIMHSIIISIFARYLK